MAFANYLIREKQYKKTNHNKTKPKIKQENEMSELCMLN